MSKKNVGLFDKVFNLFSEEVPEKGANVEQTKERSNDDVPTQSLDFDTSVPERFRRKTISSDPTTIRGVFNEEFFNHLQAEIKKNDLDGTDYYEFRKTYEALSKNMTDIAAINASFQALSAMSPDLTVEHLIETAEFYLDLINKEHDSFENQFNDKISTEIHGRESAIEVELQTQNDKIAEIERLKTEIQECEVKIQGLNDEKVVEERKLNEVKANWDFTIELVKSNINADIANIGTHLVSTKTV